MPTGLRNYGVEVPGLCFGDFLYYCLVRLSIFCLHLKKTANLTFPTQIITTEFNQLVFNAS